jgi:hypothetical protein
MTIPKRTKSREFTTLNKLDIFFENAKLKGIWHFSLPSGWTCPGASNCLTKADKVTGKITDAQKPNKKGVAYRCYASVMEARFPAVRASRHKNFELLKEAKTEKNITALIVRSIPQGLRNIGGYLRVHIGGDFFSQTYFNAWMKAAAFFPRVTFYSYTKSVHYLAKYLETNKLPDNYVFACSEGGKHDDLIGEIGIKKATVFFSQEEVDGLGLDVDHTDEKAIHGKEDFGLLLHGQQPKQSLASKALQLLKRKGFTGYNNND